MRKKVDSETVIAWIMIAGFLALFWGFVVWLLNLMFGWW